MSSQIIPDIDHETLQFLLGSARVGMWDVELGIPWTVKWDDRCKELFGVSHGNKISYAEAITSIHQDDRNAVDNAVKAALNPNGTGLYNMTYRTIGIDDGETRWVNFVGKAFFDDNIPYRFGGIARDVTADKKNEDEQVASRSFIRERVETKSNFSNMLEQAPIAIALLIGRDLVIETVNDDILYIWDKDKSIIGLPLIKALAEFEGHPFIGLIQKVYDTGEPCYTYAVKATLRRQEEDIYSDFIYTPVKNSEGIVTGVMVLAMIVTKQVLAKQKLERSEEQFRRLIEEASVASCLFAGKDMVVELANKTMLGYWGTDQTVIGLPLKVAVPELIGQPFLDILDQVYMTGEAYHGYEEEAQLEIDGVLGTYYFDFTYKAVQELTGVIYGVMNTAVDVTEKVLVRRKLEEAERKLLEAIEVAELGTWDFNPVSNEFVANSRLKAWFGLPEAEELSLQLAMDAIHENDKSRVSAEIHNTLQYTSGGNYDIEYTIKNPVTGQERVVRAKGKAAFNENRLAYRFNGTLEDITEQVTYKKRIEESELYIRDIFYNSPVAKMVFTGPDMVISTINENMIEMLGQGEKVIGRPFMESVPYMIQTPLMDRLRYVLASGETYFQPEEKKSFLRHGIPHTGYYSYIYKPLHNVAGKIYGIICTCTEVTEQVIARQLVEEAEESLRNAIEIAELGTWSIVLQGGILNYSARLREWFGIKKDETITIERAYSAIAEEDRPKVKAAIEHSITPGTNNIYDVEYRVISGDSERERIIHALGKAFFNKDGVAYKIAGTATDVTKQRQLELTLKYEVQHRTEELAASNEELSATNEELLGSNDRIMQSNQQLAQYAYVASHDLQEPLRKIQVYSNMLESQQGLSEEHKAAVVKINKSSHRMTLLIKALLEFSSLQNADQMYVPVDLNTVISDILIDFELAIEEKNASINIKAQLPVIDAISLQMNQLFYNLINNSLKFINPGNIPEIEIDSRILTENETRRFIPRMKKNFSYYDITIKDNGIGFDSQYHEKIFEVFKRLHARDVYPGSGIGLALCKKIVSQHGGYLYAESVSGKGATFHVILPDKHFNDR